MKNSSFLLSISSWLFVLLIGCDQLIDVRDDPSRYTIIYSDPASDRIFTMSADGKRKQPLGNLYGRYPKYSPDGTKIALYHWFDNPRELWLAIYAADTDSLKKLAYVTNPGIPTFIWFSWCPDGSRIVFDKPAGQPRRFDIWTVDTSGRELQQLTNSGWNLGGVWATDCSTIYYDVLSDSGSVAYLMDADGSNKRVVPYRLPGLAFGLSWSPKGNLIAFDGKLDSSWAFTDQTDLFVTDPPGRNVRRVTFDECSGKARWSPDGKKILFQSGGTRGNNLFVMDPDGANRRQLTFHGKVYLSEMLWSPDGRKIAYVYEVTPGQEWSIHVIDSDGSNDVDTGVKVRSGFDWKPM